MIIEYGLSDSSANADFAVVLGNKINSDGSPSQRLKARLNRAEELFKNAQIKSILVSGGTGVERFNEADVMKQYLVKKGIPENIIFTDSKGSTTELSAQNSYQFVGKHNYQSVFNVSQFFHIARSVFLFKEAGFKHHDIYTAHAKYFEVRDMYATVREFFGFYYYVFVFLL